MAKEKSEPTKFSSLEDLISSVKLKHGNEIIVGSGTSDVTPLSTGIPTLDHALGIGGIPKGRIIEIFGPESGGKTTTTLMIAASVQRMTFGNRTGVVAFLDVENALDPVWAAKLGVDINKMIISQPDNGEQAYDLACTFADSGQVDLIIIDSIACLVPKAEIEGTMEDDVQIGAQARMNSKALRKLTGKLGDCTLICINQIREKIGISYGSPEVTPGGRALRFYSSVRIEVRKGTKVETDKNTQIGTGVNIKVVKNKIAPPFTTATYNIFYGTPHYPYYGVDYAYELISLASDLKILTKSGNFLKYGDRTLGNGLFNSVNAAREDVGLLNEISQKIYGK